MSEETVTQWKVTWFPDHKPEESKVGDERRIRDLARRKAEFHPLIESREIVVGEWRMEP